MPPKFTQDYFIQKSKTIFGNLFDYSKVNYVNSRTPVILICSKHGEFSTIPKDHLCYKRGCIICSGSRHDQLWFITEALKIHGNRFDYTKSVFTGVKSKLVITCKVHGDFLQSPDKHITGEQGCPKCKKSYKKDIEYVIELGNKVHNYKYDYSKSIYTSMCNSKIEIICPIHGSFWQLPSNHIHGKHGCPLCPISISCKETQWLDVLRIPDDSKHRNVSIKIGKKRFVVDGFDPETNTVYEFYGDYWHGNINIFGSRQLNKQVGKTFGYLNKKTSDREKLLINNGFNIVSIWEKDFDSIFLKKTRKVRK